MSSSRSFARGSRPGGRATIRLHIISTRIVSSASFLRYPDEDATPESRRPQALQAAKVVGRAFNDELAAAGGSIPTWLVLNNLKTGAWRSQHDLAAAVGIEGPTLTRHLDGLEQAGIVERRRDPENRRAVLVELTEAGHELHARLLRIVIGFNKRLHREVSETDVAHLVAVLERLEQNALSPAE